VEGVRPRRDEARGALISGPLKGLDVIGMNMKQLSLAKTRLVSGILSWVSTRASRPSKSDFHSCQELPFLNCITYHLLNLYCD